MLVELDRVCRKHNIKYCITAGTLLGAVRHKGYIPWDDDADVAMLREEYDKFRLVADEMNPDICYFQDHYNDPDYLWQYAKLRRTGTSFVRAGQEHIKGKNGVFIDIFPLDDCPAGVPGMMLQDFRCFVMRKILYSRVGKISEKGFLKMVYSLLSKIPVERVYSQVEKMSRKSGTHPENRVRTLLFPSFGKLYMKKTHPAKIRYGMERSWFTDRAEYEFEGHKLYGTKDYDAFLHYMYNDYMTPPPKDKREPHAPVSSFNFNVNTENTERSLK
jgi:lipopolysaccharide cholinephosphotransferase